MKYVSVDIETTGLDPDTCQILEVGAVFDDLDGPPPNPKHQRTSRQFFHCYVAHREIRGEPVALDMNGGLIRRLAEYIRSGEPQDDQQWLYPGQVAQCFSHFLHLNGCAGTKVSVAGKNFAGFDKLFLERLPHWEERPNFIALHHRVLDPAMLYFDPKQDEVLPSLSKCLERAGLSPQVSHRAVDDAMDVVRLIRHYYGR